MPFKKAIIGVNQFIATLMFNQSARNQEFDEVMSKINTMIISLVTLYDIYTMLYNEK